MEKDNRSIRYAFVRFAMSREAERAVDLALDKSWGGKKIHANMARFQAKGSGLEGS